MLGDYGQGHSPVYGFSNDGYPIYGPYQAAATLALSCWAKRVYTSTSPTGCGSNKRTCVLKDPLDYTKGYTTVATGPAIGQTVDSYSGYSISAVSGVYFQDYYYDAA